MLSKLARNSAIYGFKNQAKRMSPSLNLIHRNINIPPSPYKYGKHRSNAEELINKVPVIEVDGDVAVCDGGSGALGHPLEYIQLATVSGAPQICKYCGLRFISKGHGHHH